MGVEARVELDVEVREEGVDWRERGVGRKGGWLEIGVDERLDSVRAEGVRGEWAETGEEGREEVEAEERCRERRRGAVEVRKGDVETVVEEMTAGWDSRRSTRISGATVTVGREGEL
jgi:hypothetical protein